MNPFYGFIAGVLIITAVVVIGTWVERKRK